MKLTKYAQSCFLIEIKDKRILIDPGSFVYQETPLRPEDWKNIDVLLLTHEHSDHTDPEAVAIIAKNNQPTILTNASVQKILADKGISSETLAPSEKKTVRGLTFQGVHVLHGPLPDGNQPPEVIGFFINNCLLHPGDCLYIDPAVKPEILLLSMCDTVAFSPAQAATYAFRIQPKLVIPMHYHNKRFITDTAVFAQALEHVNVPYRIMKEQETIEL